MLRVLVRSGPVLAPHLPPVLELDPSGDLPEAHDGVDRGVAIVIAASLTDEEIAEARESVAASKAANEAAERRLDEIMRGRGAGLVNAASVKPEPVRWLWRDWLACDSLQILAGAPGTGKTTLALAFAATVSAGGRWPDGTRAPAGHVLEWSGEDAIAKTLVPRLLAMGADLSRVHFVASAQDDDGPRPFDPATDIDQLQIAIRRAAIRPALLIVDPIVSAVAGDSHKNGETRRALQPLVNLAEAEGCAVLGISHFSKGTAGRETVERVTGSVAFGALARLVLATAKLPDEKGGGRILCRAKSNLGPDSGGFEYDLRQMVVPGHADLSASAVVFGEAVQGSARELLAVAEDDTEARSERSEAADFLTDLLAAGPMKSGDVKRKAEQAGLSWRTVQRAATDAGVQKRRDGFGRDAAYFWSMGATKPHVCHARQSLKVGTHGTHDAATQESKGASRIQMAASAAGIDPELLKANLTAADLADPDLDLTRYAAGLAREVSR